MMMKLKTLIGCLAVLILLTFLSGCGTPFLRGAAASSAASTPTIVPLSAVAETSDRTTLAEETTDNTPSPTPADALPTPTPVSPRPTPAASLPSPAPAQNPVSPSPTAAAVIITSVTPPAASGQATGSSSGEMAASTGESMSGAWDFTFGTMSVTQRDMKIEGTYQWYGGVDTGQIEGIIVSGLNQFRGLWVSDRSSNSQGLLRWQPAPDWNSFSGSFEGSRTGQWCGVRSGQPLPPGCGFSGVWQLKFGSPPGLTGQATLVQTGQAVRGAYVDSEGRTGEIIDGVITVESITEAKLTGVWRNDRGEQDSFDWRLDLTTGRTFQGRRDPGNSEWCGWRESTSEPEQCGW